MHTSNARRRHATAAGALSLIVSAALLAGCGGTSGPESASLGAQALRHLSAFDKKVLKDKKVTIAELLETTQVYKECLNARGIQFEQGAPGDLGPSGLITVIDVPRQVKDPDSYMMALDTKAETCLDQVSAVEDVWVLQNQASQSQIDRAEGQFVSCVRRAGLHVPAGIGFGAAGKAVRELMQGLSTAEINSSSAEGQEYSAVQECLVPVSKVAEVALPGLAQALSSLDTRGW